MDYWKLIVIFFVFQYTESVIYLRPKNDRGPGAMQAGVDCIESIERYYFKNADSTQVLNLVLYHAKNISSPATEIERVYLQGLHDRIIDQEEDEEKYYEICKI
ncbi:unnamed protein product [Diamesa tonsa]